MTATTPPKPHLLDLRDWRKRNTGHLLTGLTALVNAGDLPAPERSATNAGWSLQVRYIAAPWFVALTTITDPTGTLVIFITGRGRGNGPTRLLANLPVPATTILPDGVLVPQSAWPVLHRLHQIARRFDPTEMGNIAVRQDARQALSLATLTEADEARWRRAGVATGSRVRTYQAAGMTPAHFPAWDLTSLRDETYPADVAALFAAGLDPDTARAWLAAKFTRKERSALIAAGYTPSQALALRQAVYACAATGPGRGRAVEDVYRDIRLDWVATGIPGNLAHLFVRAGVTRTEALGRSWDADALRTLIALRGPAEPVPA